MADFFWVNGAGTWNNVAAASGASPGWSATSGGSAITAGGAGVSFPATGDAAILDANSGAGTVTKAATAVLVGSINMTGSSVTVAWSARTITADTGNVTLVAAKSSGTLSLTFTSTTDQTFTSDGFTGMTNIIRGGSSGTTQKLTFADNFTASGTLTLNRAKLDLNNRNIEFGSFASSNSTTRELLMGTGTFTISNQWDTTTTTGMTLTISTSTLAGNGGFNLISGSGFTFPPIVCNTNGLGGVFTFNSASSITSLKIVKAHSVTVTITFSQATTINGAFVIVSDYNVPTGMKLKAAVGGVAQTVTATGGFVVRGTGMDIIDITAAGITPWIARNSSSNSGNNTNIVFSGHDLSSDLTMCGVGM